MTNDDTIMQIIESARRRGKTKLNLSYIGITELPEAIANLTQLESLDLRGNQLTKLPEFIGNLTQLSSLDLRGNQLTELPESIGNLNQLKYLNIIGNRLTKLPDAIGKLVQLRYIDIEENHLTKLPEFIGNLTQLSELDLSGQKLTELPESIGNLTQLKYLYLSGNQLSHLPESIGNLTQLEYLNLRDNRLTNLPESIGNLTKLEFLDFSDNRLTKLPDSIGKLFQLKSLTLKGNQLTRLPESIGNLTQLLELNLLGQKLTELPELIGKLNQLESLNLDGNQLTDLPISIVNLSHLPNFSVQNNPLNPDLHAAYAEGTKVFWQFLHQRAKEAVVLYEAKLILVGEGGVGKSSLLGALRNDPWVENRDTTHGVEIKPVRLTDPGSGVELTLNSWDFGGQPVYRPTHQLFFSAPALYLVTWKPRQGPEQGFVKDWIKLIKHRTYNEKRPGERPRILIVATHGGPKERQAHIDQEALRKQFGHLIDGFYHIDSYTTDGLEKLKNDIAAITASIPQVGRKVPGNWKRLMNLLKKRSQIDAYITYREYEKLCSQQKINPKLAVTYATILNQLGHLIHYSDDPTLRDIVILKAEWLSKAISFVLEDRQVKDQNGLVNHLRLSEIWNDPARSAEERYPEDLHPIFLRLMELFDLSYRVVLPTSGGAARPTETSLIAQLVPGARPEGLAKDWNPEPEPGDVQLTQVCRIVDAETGISAQAEGLMYQLIVRFHPYSMGRQDYTHSRHWQQGLLLDDDYNGRALLEQIGNDIHITVQAAYPERFLHMVSREIQCLVEQSWKGLDCRIAVPCPFLCRALLDIDALINNRKKYPEYLCNNCKNWVDIDSLLTKPTTLPKWHVALAELKQGQQEIKQSMQTGFQSMRAELRRLISMADEKFTELMTNLNDEARDGPRLFSLTPVKPDFWNKPNWVSQKIRVTLWCEHSRLPLPKLCKDQSRGVYEFDRPRQWLLKAAPYVRFVAGTLRLILPVAGSAVKWALADAEYKKIDEDLDLSQKSFDALLGAEEAVDDALFGDHKDNLPDAELQGAQCDETRYGRPMMEQAGLLRELQALIQKRDPSFGGLVRVRNKRGEFLWVHPDFQKEY